MPTPTNGLYFFRCSVSEDLYGASPNLNGKPLPTPGGGKWLPVEELAELGKAVKGYDAEAAAREVEAWGCHWFSSQGPGDIYWGPNGPPKS